MHAELRGCIRIRKPIRMKRKALPMQVRRFTLYARPLPRRGRWAWVFLCCALTLLASLTPVWGSLQFDVFLGYRWNHSRGLVVPGGL